MDAALDRWEEHECQKLLPDDLRREVRAPLLSRAALKGLRARLTAEIGAECSVDFGSRMPFSRN